MRRRVLCGVVRVPGFLCRRYRRPVFGGRKQLGWLNHKKFLRRSPILYRRKSDRKSAAEILMGWKSVGTLFVTGMGLLYYYRYSKEQQRKDKSGNKKGQVKMIGKALVGGPFTLIDQSGRPLTDLHFRGKYMLIYFGFTMCPDICPAELTKMAKALDIIKKKKGCPEDLIIPVFISVDPFRDTVSRVREYISHYHPRMIGFTGTPNQIAAVSKAYRVYSYSGQKDEDDDDYVVDHSVFFFLMDLSLIHI
eukprot:TRINITY_DN5852_c0_g1_i4.p1 TRINITY_DN5852_c0_g1~~TRINITY_DN5852_c0_g1_i4.p1  ORF type:complete len:262 (-),score=32.59 TRINITY_DN5852_c0_g1_i4:38-784(-)